MTQFPEAAAASRPPTWKKVGVVGLFLFAIVLIFLLDLHRYLTLDAIKSNRDRLLAFTEGHYGTAVAAYVLTYCLVVAMSLPGAALLTLLGGFLFGPLAATCYVNIGATIGATIAFLAARYILRDWVERRFGRWLQSINDGFEQHAFSYLLTLRLIPIFPFFLTNLVAGLTRVKVTTYIVATSIGIIPGAFVYAYAGRQLGTINSLSEIASPRVLLAFVLLALLAVIPVVYRKLSPPKSVPSRKPSVEGSRP